MFKEKRLLLITVLFSILYEYFSQEVHTYIQVVTPNDLKSKFNDNGSEYCI